MPSLLENEFADSFTNWKQDPSPQNSSKILKALEPVTTSALRTYVGPSPSPALKSHAKLLTLDALGRYDHTRAKLRTHLMTNLQGLRRHAAEETQIIGVPERVRLDQYHLYRAETELQDQLNRAPSTQELSDHLGISSKRIEHIRKGQMGVAEGQLAQRTNEDGEPLMAAPAVQNNNHDAWLRFIHHDLEPADQVILEHVTGLHGREILPKGAIAKKLGISPSAISQRAQRIQKLIDARETLTGGMF